MVVVVAVKVVVKTGIRSVGAGGGRAGGREAAVAAGVRSRSKGGCSESQDRSVHLLMVGSELGHHVRDVLGDNLGE